MEDDKIRLRIEYDNQYTEEKLLFETEFSAHSSISDMLTQIERFLLAVGYSQELISVYLKLEK